LDHAEGLSSRVDGRGRSVAIRASRIDFGGRPALLLHVRDVTEQKQTEEALRASEARLRTMLESLDNVAVQAYEADGTITFWNRASERLYGYSAEQALGRDMIELLHPPATRTEERQIMAEAIATGQVVPAQEVEVVTRDGLRVCIIASRILHARPGRPPEFFCFDVDITDRKRAEEELALRQAELLHAARLSSVGQMVAALSHEVAQPLSAIGNFTAACGLLLESNSRESWELLKEYNQAIGKQNQRCGAILERLRHFSRRSPAHRSPSDINHLVRESVELIVHELRREGVKIGYELSEGLPPVVCDRVQLEQVIVNLLANARDALRDQPPGRRQITIRSHRDPSGLAVEFEDSGSGLAPDVVPRMFEPFFTTKSDGMGIGLSICRTIMRDHGGSIEATNGPGGGALFRLCLPTLDPQLLESK
jgi:two-component system sensor kinase FixL